MSGAGGMDGIGRAGYGSRNTSQGELKFALDCGFSGDGLPERRRGGVVVVMRWMVEAEVGNSLCGDASAVWS
jgi:hypothetical protein